MVDFILSRQRRDVRAVSQLVRSLKVTNFYLIKLHVTSEFRSTFQTANREC